MATAFPRNWQLLIFAFVCLLGARLALEAFALSGALRGLLTPIVILACAAIWWLRQRRIISAWPMASDPRINRTVIALTALEGLPKALVTVNFLLCVGVALWFAFALLHPRPLSDPELWVVVPILAYCIFALLRAARGFGLALMGGAGRQSS